MNTQQIIDEASSLPTEERVVVVDTLLRSLNPPESEVDKRWGTIAQRRLLDLREGRSPSVDGEKVFEQIWSRFNRFPIPKKTCI